MARLASASLSAPILTDERGRAISLGPELGRGGEGIVYEVEGRPDVVAKLYHRPLDAARVAKLRAMAELSSGELRRVAAWPIATLAGAPGAMAGILLPRVVQHRPIHHLYGPRSRLSAFPDADWRFLVQVAANLARAFAAIHARGQVIGDVNQGNVLVAPDGSITLIDCDSFQIDWHSRRFPCEVGVSTYQPPEFQDVPSFRGLARTPNHDGFGLAVLVFQLLMLGRHPFAGTQAGAELTIERAIRGSYFAYGRNAATRSLRPPPLAPTLATLPPPVAALFESAFAPPASNGVRPAAPTWASALDALAQATVICPRNLGHSFSRHLSACPWCDLERRAGTIVFAHKAFSLPPPPLLDLDRVWSEIEGVVGPGSAPPLPAKPPRRPRRVIHVRRPRLAERVADHALLPVALASLLLGLASLLTRDPGSLVAAGACGFVASSILATRLRQTRGRSDARRRAREEWRRIAQRWPRETGDEAFAAKRKVLEDARGAYLALARSDRDSPQSFASRRREQQLQNDLARHLIVGAGIKGVGPGREATLASYGIESAADVTPDALRAIPGFGRGLIDQLLAWRRDLEAGFADDPNRPIDPAELRALEDETRQERERLAQTLRRGADDLRALADQARRNRVMLRMQLERAWTKET